MIVHLVDGTYEIFRQYYAPRPGHLDSDGIEIGATRGVVQSVFTMLQDGATHVGVATDHVIESFRNDMWPTYKSSAGMDPLLLAQFDWLEDALRALGVAVWPMVDVEADDGLASAAVVAAADPRVEQVIICTPDKDLGQCVGGKVIQWDRRQDKLIDADGVIAKFGVAAESIPDWLALVGDSADGFRACPGSARNPPRRCSLAIGTWRTSRPRPRTGTSRCVARPSWRRRSCPSGQRPRCSSCWPRCAPTPRSARSTTGSGPAPPRTSPPGANASAGRVWPKTPPRWPTPANRDAAGGPTRLLLGRGESGGLQVCVHGGRLRSVEQPLGQHDHGEVALRVHEERRAEPTVPAERAGPRPVQHH